MSEPFVAEIRIFPFTFAPRGWALCNGQLMAIRQNTALYSLLGTNYGGDGVNTFGLPNLQGRFPIQSGQGTGLSQYVLGQAGGTTAVTLDATQLPAHNHPENVLVSTGTSNTPSGGLLTQPGLRNAAYFGSDATTAALAATAVAPTGGSQPHNNLPPFLTLNYCIALQGVFPQRP